MTYLASSLIALGLYFVELSLLPHFSPWLTVPFMMLPFLALLSARDRTIFPILLGGAVGLMMDATTLSHIPVFAIAFISVTAISKVFFAQFISYGESRASLLLTLLGLVIIYGFEIPTQLATFTWSIGWLIPILFNIALTFIVLVFMIFGFRKYFDWVEKTTEGRYR